MQYAVFGFGSSLAAAEVGRIVIEPMTTLQSTASEDTKRVRRFQRGAWITAFAADCDASVVDTVRRIAGDSTSRSPATNSAVRLLLLAF